MPEFSKPHLRPFDPRFSCGPTKKHPGWSFDGLSGAALSRSHRAPAGLSKINEAIERTHALLECPADYRIAMLGGSDTAAMEAAMWSMLGARGVDVFSWDEFGRRWHVDACDELKLKDLRTFTAPYGQTPDFNQAKPDRDIVFTWNATAAGAKVPNADWIAFDRTGLTIVDATSAAFAIPLDWDKIDVLTFSWQKAMGSEAQHGMVVLSPRALERLETYRPPWPVPRLLQLYNKDGLNEGLFAGKTLNTPSLMCIEDYLSALKWATKEGGLSALHARTAANFEALAEWVERTGWIDWQCADAACRSPVSVTLKFADPDVAALDADAQWTISRKMGSLLERENAALDVTPHPVAVPGLRIWCGPTIDADDVAALCPWLDWAYGEARAG